MCSNCGGKAMVTDSRAEAVKSGTRPTSQASGACITFAHTEFAETTAFGNPNRSPVSHNVVNVPEPDASSYRCVE